MTFDSLLSWAAFALGLLLLVGYEWRVLWLAGRRPDRLARTANAQARMHWVNALSAQPGFEIVAVQALRNSLMSATISASTAALAVMGSVSLAGVSLANQVAHWSPHQALHLTLQALLVLTLFSSYVCSAMAMRHYGHASFVMSMPVASPERAALNPMAANHVRRAGLLYSWGLRLFLMAAPLVTGIVHPYALPIASALLLVALHFFDQPGGAEAE